MDALRDNIASAFVVEWNKEDSLFKTVRDVTDYSLDELKEIVVDAIVENIPLPINKSLDPDIVTDWLKAVKGHRENDKTIKPSIINNNPYNKINKNEPLDISLYIYASDIYAEEMFITEQTHCEYCVRDIINSLEYRYSLTKHEFEEIKEAITEFITSQSFYSPELVVNGSVNINITLAYNGEANVDFSSISKLTNIHVSKHYPEEYVVSNAITWLIHQQGYTLADLFSGVKSPFLDSVRTELVNNRSDMTALTLCVNVSKKNLEEIVLNGDNFVLSHNMNCGIFDMWYGTSSCMNIILEKDVVVPSSMLFNIKVEGSNDAKCTVGQVCDFTEKFWKPAYLGKSFEPAMLEFDTHDDILSLECHLANNNISRMKP